MAFVQVDAFTQSLRRFSVGATSSWWIFTKPEWTPPYGTLSELALLFMVATTALYLWFYLYSWPAAGSTSCSMNSRRMSPGAVTKAIRRRPKGPETSAGPHTTS